MGTLENAHLYSTTVSNLSLSEAVGDPDEILYITQASGRYTKVFNVCKREVSLARQVQPPRPPTGSAESIQRQELINVYQ